MNRSEKEAAVQDLGGRLSRARALVLTNFSGLKVEQMTGLRQQLKDKGLDYLVVKNTLFRRAAEGTPADALAKEMTGPNGVAFSYDDPVELAKVLVDFAKDNKKFEIKGGMLEGKPMAAEAVADLAKLPPREVLLAQLLGAMNGVSRNLVCALAGIPRKLLYALKAIEEQKSQAA